MHRNPLLVSLSKHMTVDRCFLPCLYRQLFANDQAQSTLHQRQSRLDRSYISLVIYKVIKQISNSKLNFIFDQVKYLHVQIWEALALTAYCLLWHGSECMS